MAGTFQAFAADVFRTNIRFVMDMGSPPDSDDQAIFYFAENKTFDKGVDDGDVPFDPTAVPTIVQPDPVSVSCTYIYKNSSGEVVDFGVLEPSLLTVYLLDEDYAQVEGCAYVMVRGEKYVYRNTEAPIGLFDVGVFTLNFYAESAT